MSTAGQKDGVTKIVYLGKEGKTFGPFTEQEIDELRRSGEFHQYSYVWTSTEPHWAAINPPPPPPPTPGAPSQAAATPQAPSKPQQFAAPTPTPRAPSTPAAPIVKPAGTPAQNYQRRRSDLQVICHNLQFVIAGQIENVSQTGFSLMSEDFSSAMPPFGRGSKVFLNFLDEGTGKAENITATIGRFGRKDGRWEFQMNWDRIPDIVLSER